MTKRSRPAPVHDSAAGLPITEQEKQHRLRAVQGALAINSIEGAPISDDDKQLYMRWANGQITHKEMMDGPYSRG